MSTDSDKPEPRDEPASENEAATADASSGKPADGAIVRASDDGLEGDGEPTEGDDVPEAGHIGVKRYVHAAFFGAGILAAYLSGKLLMSAWNFLADWPAAVRSLPVLIEYGEDERASITLSIGAVVGVLLVLRYYRRPAVRGWATDVAGELAKVTWPDKETVTNGTVVVLVAGALATLFIALVDRLWVYLTTLIYGA